MTKQEPPPASPEPSPGRWLREQREVRDIGAREMADRVGVVPQSLYKWEADKSKVSDEIAELISEIFGMDEIEVRRRLGLWTPKAARGLTGQADLDRPGQAAIEYPELVAGDEFFEYVYRGPAPEEERMMAIRAVVSFRDVLGKARRNPTARRA